LSDAVQRNNFKLLLVNLQIQVLIRRSVQPLANEIPYNLLQNQHVESEKKKIASVATRLRVEPVA
jgi:hypothetical protein